ncbi:MAG: TIGR00282 family metallophosphoesterase [Phycisphaeraceae bacterium]|nr:TIGR00282 family metallophosphoesterase [Phycisphaeraceae bacterium]
MSLRIGFIGDVVGVVGVRAVEQALGDLRRDHAIDQLIINGENASKGSGLTPGLFNRLIEAGADAVTLGDHVYRRAAIMKTLETDDRIARPANLPEAAKGRRWIRLPLGDEADGRSLFVLTVLGRAFIKLPADDPFATIDQMLAALPEPDPLVIVEVHAEATAEKVALRWHLDGRVAAVVGTHTHVATADAEVSEAGTAYITDLGMSGPHDGVIGRRADRVLKHMTTAMPAPFDVAEGDLRINGAVIEVDPASGRATGIERIEKRVTLD